MHIITHSFMYITMRTFMRISNLHISTFHMNTYISNGIDRAVTRKFKSLTMRIIVCLSILFMHSSYAASSYDAIDSLPDLGSSSSKHLSRNQAEQLGKAYIRQARSSMKFINDPLLLEYLNKLGKKIIAKSNSTSIGQAPNFEFYIVANPQFNAFAVPSGQIVIHSGIVENTSSEDELAAVLAHEIAHVTQNHTARGFELSRYDNLISLATILAAAASGSHEIAQAAVFAGTASTVNRNLSYSRSFEREADAIGIRNLARAGYNPQAAVSLLEKLNSAGKFNGSAAFEFLLSHPLTESRISAAVQRANKLTPTIHENTVTSNQSLNFIDFKARVESLYGNDSQRREALLKEEINAISDESNRAALLHKYGLSQARNNNLSGAVSSLREANRQNPNTLMYQIALAETLIEAGNNTEGKALFLDIRQSKAGKEQEIVDLYYGNALVISGEQIPAIELLTQLRQKNPDQPDVHIMLARAYGELNQGYRSYLSRAEYHYLRGNYEFAITQFDNALELTNNPLQRESIIERRDDIKDELKQIRKALR